MFPSSQDEEPDFQTHLALHLHSSRGKTKGASRSFADEENEPLLAGPSTPRKERHSPPDSLDTAFERLNFRTTTDIQHSYHSSDESYILDFIMEKVKSTKFAHFVEKLAVESEPGLTNAQLMLNNHDLKPGMHIAFYF